MGILTNFVVADEDDIAAIGESQHPVDEWDGIERRDIDAAKLAVLHCLATGDELGQALYLYEPIYVNADEVMVLRMADYLVERLSGFDEEALERIGEELAASEEFELAQFDPDEVQDVVLALAALSQLAVSQDQALFVWIHPLLT